MMILNLLQLFVGHIISPREFDSVHITACYIHPHANAANALTQLHDVVTTYSIKHPHTLSILTGDFNRADLKDVLPNYNQMVLLNTRGNKILDNVFINTSKNVYKCKGKSKIGESDHGTILLSPVYVLFMIS